MRTALLQLIIGLFCNVATCKLMSLGLWSPASSTVSLKSLCDSSTSDAFDTLVIDVNLFLEPRAGSDSFILKMREGPALLKFPKYPHYGKFVNPRASGKSSVSADFYDLGGLGEALQMCSKRRKNVLLQVTIGGRMKIRQTILLYSLIWNSFFTDLHYSDRPFGRDFRFNGIHLIIQKDAELKDSKSSKQRNRLSERRHDDNALAVIRGLQNMAESEKSKVIVSTFFHDEKSRTDAVLRASDFSVIANAAAPPSSGHFVVMNCEKSCKKFKNNKLFKGILLSVDSSNNRHVLNGLASRNPTSSNGGTNVFTMVVFVLVGLLLVTLLLFFIHGHWWKRRDEDKVEN
jgi:hypothetical protein